MNAIALLQVVLLFAIFLVGRLYLHELEIEQRQESFQKWIQGNSEGTSDGVELINEKYIGKEL
jgi:hypothetical protein